MQLVRRIARVLTAIVAVLVYIWFAAVNFAPAVRRRKEARRLRRR